MASKKVGAARAHELKHLARRIPDATSESSTTS